MLLHGCCHNPTGANISVDQWGVLADMALEQGFTPLVDIAYQGFGDGLEADAAALRAMAARVPEMLIAASCSKNFALYRDRTGCAMAICETPEARAAVEANLKTLMRVSISMPPDHGAAVVAIILGDADLRTAWVEEVGVMRSRLNSMRALLAGELNGAAPNHDFSHFTQGKGMFSFIGISPEQVARLKTDYAVYAVASSRINFAGVTPGNLGHLADAIAGVLRDD